MSRTSGFGNIAHCSLTWAGKRIQICHIKQQQHEIFTSWQYLVTFWQQWWWKCIGTFFQSWFGSCTFWQTSQKPQQRITDKACSDSQQAGWHMRAITYVQDATQHPHTIRSARTRRQSHQGLVETPETNGGSAALLMWNRLMVSETWTIQISSHVGWCKTESSWRWHVEQSERCICALEHHTAGDFCHLKIAL